MKKGGNTMNAFSTLAQLVKERKSGQVVVPDVRNEVETIKSKLEILEKAGFTAIHTELESQVRILEREEQNALMTNRLAIDGYLIIDIPYHFKKGWDYRSPVFVKPIQKKITRTVEVSNWWGTKTHPEERHEWKQTEYSLMLCNHYNWRGGVPISIAETLIEFQEKYELKNASTDFHILAVLHNEEIGSYVRQADPLLLYSIDGHAGSRFAVLAWWGADIETIEKELELDRKSFRAVKILESFQ